MGGRGGAGLKIGRYRDFASRCADRPKIPAVFASRRRDPASPPPTCDIRRHVAVLVLSVADLKVTDPVPGPGRDNYYALSNAKPRTTGSPRTAPLSAST